jgi:hypothetical protein
LPRLPEPPDRTGRWATWSYAALRSGRANIDKCAGAFQRNLFSGADTIFEITFNRFPNVGKGFGAVTALAYTPG